MWTVKQVSDIAGVSVRTLHHYDAIGLLKPAKVTEAGYRLYDEGALGRLQSILLFRELGFPLQEIKSILDRPGFDPMDALAQQLQLLERKRRHVEGLISLARGILEKGAWSMDFQAFDTKALEQYKAEAKGKWGHTKAYMEFVQKKEADIAGNPGVDGVVPGAWGNAIAAPGARAGAGEDPGAAKPYHPAFLYLHPADPARAGADVYGGPPLSGEHRPGRRPWRGGVRTAGHPGLLPKDLKAWPSKLKNARAPMEGPTIGKEEANGLPLFSALGNLQIALKPAQVVFLGAQ